MAVASATRARDDITDRPNETAGRDETVRLGTRTKQQPAMTAPLSPEDDSSANSVEFSHRWA